MKEFYIIAPLSALSRRTRLFKLSRFIASKYPGIRLTHLAWERVRGESEEVYLTDINIEKNVILRGGGYGGAKVKAMYLLWMVKVFIFSIKLKKHEKVWALGFESAFPAMLASKIKGFQVVFDDADRFSMLFPLPIAIKKIVEFLEIITSRNVNSHVIPCTERYDFKSEKFFVLKNTPSCSELEKAKYIYESRDWPKSDLIINVNGWLGSGRGMHAALALSKALKNESFSIILAGKLDCENAIELSKQDNVLYLGEISNSEALASYYCSDFVLTYYNPSSQINCFAESNKWGDALKTVTGIIVNKEIKTANYLREYGAAVSFGYYDTDSLVNFMREMLKPENKALIKINVKILSGKYGCFEEQLEPLIKGIS